MSNQEVTAAIAIIENTPNGDVVEYGTNDNAETVERIVGAAWRVDWQTPAYQLSSGRYRAPIFRRTPLADAYRAAAMASTIADDAWQNDDTCGIGYARERDQHCDPFFDCGCATKVAMLATDAALSAAQDAWAASDEPREYVFANADQREAGHVLAPSVVAQALRAWATASDWDRSATLWIRATARVIEPTYGEGASHVEIRVTLHPPAPACAGGHAHDWRSPIMLVGGIPENPGVAAHGGGVNVHEICAHCGTHLHTDTWATDPDTGEHGTKIYYAPPDAETLAWVAKLGLVTS